MKYQPGNTLKLSNTFLSMGCLNFLFVSFILANLAIVCNNQNCCYKIVRTDRATIYISMGNFFTTRQMLRLPKRGIHHLGLLEPTMKNLKSKLIRNIQVHPGDYSPGGLSKMLEAATDSINATETVHGLTPQQVNKAL